MDRVKKTFDEWALSGRSELMEKEHGKNVLKFLNGISFNKLFSFLDVGCGNGWVIRKISQLENCKKAIGIDKSKNMIKNAKSKSKSQKEEFVVTDLENWNHRGKFDYVFSMEAIYYSESVEDAVKKVFKLLKKDGEFFCGTDFYKDNKATAGWSKMMNVNMHLLSKSQWRKIFNDAGFETKTRQIKDQKSRKKWKRDFGTLFIIGKKSV